MADIISRIRLEAVGGDAVAREIRKIKEAYKETTSEAKGLAGPGYTGWGAYSPDAFQTAVRRGQVPTESEDTAQRSRRTSQEKTEVRERENQNKGYGKDVTQGIGAGVNVAQNIGQGKFLGAAASGLGGLAGMAGAAGIVGVAAMAGFGLFKAFESLATNEYARIEQLWGTGTAQRLGVSYQTLRGQQIGYGRQGVPLEAINQFYMSASQSGFKMTGAIDPAVTAALEAATSFGVNPALAAGMLGSLARGRINTGTFANMDMYKMMGGTFGKENMQYFIQAFTQNLETAMQQGISISPEEAKRQANMIGAYAQYGGFSPTGAAAIYQQQQQVGRQAAQLSRPEDIIAFQALRRKMPQASITDVMLMMEQSPDMVNKEVYDYLKQTTGGDKELMRLRLKQYMGPGTSMNAVQKLVETMEGIDREGFGRLKRERLPGPEPLGRAMEDPRVSVAAKQSQMLAEMEKGMQSLSNTLKQFITGTGNIHLSAYNVIFREGEYTTKQKVEAAITKIKETEAYANLYELAGLPAEEYNQGKVTGTRVLLTPELRAKEVIGGLRKITKQQLQSRYEQEGDKNAAKRAQEEVNQIFEPAEKGISAKDLMTDPQVISLLTQMRDLLRGRGIVFTDGDGK